MEELAGPMNMCELCDYVTPRPDLMAKHRFVVVDKGSSCASGREGGPSVAHQIHRMPTPTPLPLREGRLVEII
jgi:hypothetical protein